MVIRTYVIDKNGKLSPERIRADLRAALIDLGLPPLDAGVSPRASYETNPNAVIYRLTIEPVKRK